MLLQSYFVMSRFVIKNVKIVVPQLLLDIFKFNAEKSVGLYTIDVRLSFKIRVR